MSRVVIVATGGTIQNTSRGRISVDRVLADIRSAFGQTALPLGAQLEIRDVLRAGAEAFGPREWRRIATAVETAVRDPSVDGVVVTHGTFTAEETAYVLQLVIRSSVPVALAVSQRKHGAPGNDGDRNLLDAIRVAADSAAPRRGVLLVANEEIHGARDVTKENQRPSGFSSSPLGLLGTIQSDRVSFYRTPDRRHTHCSEFSIELLTDLPRVDIVAVYAGADGSAIRALVEAGARGLVTAGFPYSGIATPLQTRALIEAAERGVAVVLASRGRGGRIPARPDDRFVRADDLSAHKARILLALGLAASIPDLQRLFDEY